MKILNNRNNKGMTLVELVVSIAIFGIISVGFLSIFLESLLIIERAGNRSESVAYVSSELERKLAGSDPVDAATLTITEPQAIITYNPGTVVESSNPVDGKLILGTELNQQGQEIEVTVYIPSVTP